MNTKILINKTHYETRVAIIEDDETRELHVERTQDKGNVSNIYLGKVLRVLPSMQSAFIDIGLKKAAFINVSDLLQHYVERNQNPNNPVTRIEKILFQGQTVLVEILKDGTGNKGARVTDQINIAGRYLVYTPRNAHIGVSRRMDNEQERENLRQRLQALRPDDEKGGYIARTNAYQASDKELLADMAYLRNLWLHIQKRARSMSAPCLVHKELDLSHRVLRDFVRENTSIIEVDDIQTYEDLVNWAKYFTPEMSDKLHYYANNIPLFDRYHINRDIAQALSRRVDLPSGGYLIFDHSEALTSIDVNTGALIKSHDFHSVTLKTNLEAATVLASQIRIRNLGGIIIVDFVDMDKDEDRQRVLETLNQELKKDWTFTTCSEFSSLGLVEITRKRTRESLARMLCEPCPTCQAKGSILTAQSVCYDIMREIQREALQFHPKEFRIIASQSVIDLFLDEESEHLAILSDQINKPITLSVQSNYTQDQYDIILM